MENKKDEKKMSSGAEKVENIAGRADEKAETATKRKPVSEKREREKQEKEKAKKRVDVALLKEKRKEKKAEAKEARKKRKQELAEKRAEKRAERKAEKEKRKALLKNESKAQKAKRKEKEKAARLAAKKAEQERRYKLKLERRDARLKRREQRLQDRQHRRETRRTPGFGGWLAAVISLGAACLVLAAIVTFGSFRLTRTNAVLGTGYRSTVYELTSIVDEIDEDLSKARVSASGEEQSRVLTDLLVQARLAENSLEKLPLSVEQDRNLTTFLNRTARQTERMLETIREKGQLSAEDEEQLALLYAKHHEMRAELDGLLATISEKDWKDAFDDEKGKLRDGLKKLENFASDDKFPSPHAAERGGGEESLTSAAAQELCNAYFDEYDFQKTEYTGETFSRGLRAYNFFLTDKDGMSAFAQVTDSGKLLCFEYYAPCKGARFDGEQSLAIARAYLDKLGYDQTSAVFASETGAEIDFTFVYEQNGVLYYPDLLKVKVCKERGIVSGFDASEYLKHHRGRDATNAKISLEEAENCLHEGLFVRHSALVVIPCRGKEVLAYEFVCEYEEETYFIYVDAKTGKETEIYVVEVSAQGKFLR